MRWVVIPFLLWLLISASHGSNSIVYSDTYTPEETPCSTATSCPTASR